MTNRYFQKHTKEDSEKKHVKDLKFFLKKTKGRKRPEKKFIEEKKKVIRIFLWNKSKS